MNLNFRAAFRALTRPAEPAPRVFAAGNLVMIDSEFYRRSTWPRFGNGIGTVLRVVPESEHPYLVHIIGEGRPARYTAFEVFTLDDPRASPGPWQAAAGRWDRWQLDAVAASRLRR